ncbi:hypothetical protein Shal_0270 [Shewanella halifaxensis HAW-EB4]|uniref:Alginate export domain-containing protein n=1 Tax=Shewanella halifaxensis (strain HAW-EB4) TaxID=458817 RepID=B0TNU3_SHEHH|nr:hypothetical protein Shal_0270 [Shewanella halifaxensis HAW-EB4]
MGKGCCSKLIDRFLLRRKSNCLAYLVGLCSLPLSLAAAELQHHGHLKYEYDGYAFSDSSVYQARYGQHQVNQTAQLRYHLGSRWQSGWLVEVDYQLLAGYGEHRFQATPLMNGYLGLSSVIDDELRLFNLTNTLSEHRDFVMLQRLDRAIVGYQTDNNVVKFGRQAITWGNGQFFNPMDFVNPFDPASLDKEYKTGDDMVYGQHLLQDGSDLQAAYVIRRDGDSDITADVATLALKYHGFIDYIYEYDLLLAEHYDNTVAGVSSIISVGGAIWATDLVATWGETNYLSLVSNWGYSWVGFERNMSGTLEYFYNGLGISDGDYSPESLLQHPELVAKIERGELYNLARHYLTGSLYIEMTPLWSVSQNLFYNASDNSALYQVLSQNSLSDELRLTTALTVPIGANGTEYGGLKFSDGQYFSFELLLYAQLAWYF